ncbi:IS5-like element IS1478 family transposase [Xanthomonas campestris pv. campestris]|nr:MULTISPECIES: IS5-like element IS1478 family transposase [Xanthomonas]AAM39954.1 IS1478 transposase [Xanthomonas campestris pv. campestris str. ATCC 33913]AAM41393.1 IS1478 transposase [Xanthomonas campestris pv. campestris str. ATCC 33913]AAM41764.1 IS1478 transposase [Xanthomonas campestris pv. campestris str. ATCC 33913]AAM42393.1 IS1478 transposase [Xanthomonas campestris pv. campestris str. ATCC 33913]AAM42613.1 IS1478 transposase [Xanthomonas campestris pv. campestris str. ATCC 33913]
MHTRRPAAEHMPAEELFRSRLENQIDLRHPLAQLSQRMPWTALEQALSSRLPATQAGGGRPALPVRLIAGLLYLKHAYDLSDEAVCERWLENPYWQFFTGEVVFQTRLPCDASSLTRWRQRLDEAGMEELLAHTINAAHAMQAVDARELSRVIVDTTVQEKAIAYPTDSRLLEVARKKLVLLAKRYGIGLRQSYARQGPALSRKAGRYAHARQFKRMQRVLRRQRTVLGRVLRDIARKLDQVEPGVRERIAVWLERAQRLYTQRPKDKQKLYALHAPEVECIGKGKARQAYEFGVKVGIAVTACKGLVVGARSFPGNPYDGDTLAEQLEQTRGLLQDLSVEPTVAIVDLGYRGREVDGVQVLHRGKAKTLTRRQWRWIKRRQAVEPVIGHLKDDCRLRRCRLKGAQGDALHVLGCAAGYNLRWLLRWIAFLRAWMRAMGWPSFSAVPLSPMTLGA